MKIPTAAELAEAHRAINDGGPHAPETLALSLLCMTDPTLRPIIDRLSAVQEVSGLGVLVTKAQIVSAVVTGLNIALRIGEAREGSGPVH